MSPFTSQNLQPDMEEKCVLTLVRKYNEALSLSYYISKPQDINYSSHQLVVLSQDPFSAQCITVLL